MVGLIQKLLLDLVESARGAETVREVKRRAGVPEEKEFRIDEVYDDAEWRRLLGATCEVLNLTPERAEETFADFFCKDSMKRWPMWFDMSKNAREFLVRQPKIHNGFATGVQNTEDQRAIDDKFHLEKRNGGLVMHYSSPNRLCGLYAALARWIIKHYGDDASVQEARCLKKGDSECEIHIRWA